jgi:8-oxo-dGTP diphosphatase
MPHIHEKIDFVAEALIVYDNTVLLRMHDKFKMWLGPGGHVELNEDPMQAAVREAKEETGLDIMIVGTAKIFSDTPEIRELIPPRFMNRHRINDSHEHVSLTYLATSKTNIVSQGEHEHSDNMRWFTKEELMDPSLVMSDRMRSYALTALEEVGMASSVSAI